MPTTKEKITQHSTFAKPGDRRQRDVLMPFLQGPSGRMLRVMLGLGVIVVGILFLQGTAGFLVAVIGLIPIFTALSGVCVICPLFGYTFEGYRKTESDPLLRSRSRLNQAVA